MNEYIGKVVVTRGIGSGVNAGVLLGFGKDEKTVFLSNSYFLRNWKWNKSFGSMASLSSGDIKGPAEIAKIHHDSIITDCACIVIAPDSLLKKLEKLSS